MTLGVEKSTDKGRGSCAESAQKGLRREGAGSREGLLGKPCFRAGCRKQWEYGNFVLLIDCV